MELKSILESAAKYLIAGIIIVGCFILIFTGRGDQVQPWTVMGIIVGWIVRDSAGTAAAQNVERMNASQPTITATSGPPAVVTSTPSNHEEEGQG